MSDPITTVPPRANALGVLLKAAVVIPDLIIASLLWLVIIALLPPVAGFVLTVGGLIFAAVLAAGLGEDLTVRVLYRARRATPAEAPHLAVARRIATRRLDADGVRLRIVSHGCLASAIVSHFGVWIRPHCGGLADPRVSVDVLDEQGCWGEPGDPCAAREEVVGAVGEVRDLPSTGPR